MNSANSVMNSEHLLKLSLRVIGGASLTALIFVLVPFSWMQQIHDWLGMGSLPNQPVVGYLARSTSAFYSILGGLLWFISFDPKRYRLVIIYLGSAFTFFGIALLFIDWLGGMPFFWKLWEGPFVIAFGMVLLYLSRKIK